MAGTIFINYRRDDSAATAGRLHDRLSHVYGPNHLFMDVDHIPAGVDFVAYLDSQVAACDVILVVIGPGWLDAKEEDGGRRLDNPDDFVALEIAAALARNIRVIPVLVDGARMPKADRLPAPIKGLARRNAVELRNAQFGRDAEALIEKIREALSSVSAETSRKELGALAPGGPNRLFRMAIVAALALVVGAGWLGYEYLVVKPNLEHAKGEQERQAAATAEQERQAAVKAERERQATAKAERERQAKVAAEAEAKQQLATARPGGPQEIVPKLFTLQNNSEAFSRGNASDDQSLFTRSVGECEQTCAQKNTCNIYTYNKQGGTCYLYTYAELKPNAFFDTGIRNAVATPNSLFTIQNNSEAFSRGNTSDDQSLFTRSAGECEQMCAQRIACNVYTYDKQGGMCYLYTRAELKPNAFFDAGVRK
jgi:TIR domain/PAN domain